MAVQVVNHAGTTVGDDAYTLISRIGEGDFGVVYLARQRRTGHEVAVKVLKHRVPQRVFWREVQALARVGHEHAVRVLDAHVERDGTMWIAMPLVEGETLYRWLEKRGPVPLGQVVQLVQRIAGALHEAHEVLIVHRDLKPANIMIRERKGELIPTLLDFGIAKWIEDAGGSIAGSSDGARAYRAPECWKDPQSAGPASDVYALGAIVYECLAGRHPFAGAHSREEWEHAHCTKADRPDAADSASANARAVGRSSGRLASAWNSAANTPGGLSPIRGLSPRGRESGLVAMARQRSFACASHVEPAGHRDGRADEDCRGRPRSGSLSEGAQAQARSASPALDPWHRRERIDPLGRHAGLQVAEEQGSRGRAHRRGDDH